MIAMQSSCRASTQEQVVSRLILMVGCSPLSVIISSQISKSAQHWFWVFRKLQSSQQWVLFHQNDSHQKYHLTQPSQEPPLERSFSWKVATSQLKKQPWKPFHPLHPSYIHKLEYVLIQSRDLEGIDAISNVWNDPKSELHPQVRVLEPVLGGVISLEGVFYGCLNSNSGILK